MLATSSGAGRVHDFQLHAPLVALDIVSSSRVFMLHGRIRSDWLILLAIMRATLNDLLQIFTDLQHPFCRAPSIVHMYSTLVH